MQPDLLDVRTNRWDKGVRLAVAAWSVVLAVVCVRGVIWPLVHTVYPTYTFAAGNWLAGEDLYYCKPPLPYLDQYRYGPLATTFFVPFHLLPLGVGSVLWRLLNAAALLAGFAWWLRAVAPAATSSRRQAVLFLLVLPLSLTSLNNGQCNPLVIGLLLAAMAGAAGQRWNLAAACAALACAFKVYPIAVGLLLAAVYPRRFAPRLVVALGVVAVLPFLCQRPEYVAHQYDRWFHKLLSEEGRKAAPFSIAYRDLWLLFRQYAPIEVRTYQALQLVAAAGCALVCLAGRRRGWPPRRMLTAVTTQGTCWMMLFGPTTESSSYVMLAPALAWSLGGARLERWPAVARFPPLVSFGLFLIAQLAGLTKVAGAVHALGPQPLGALLLWVSYLMVAGRDLIWPSPPTETVSDPASLPKAA